MKVLNIMLSPDLGGIQQAFLDYSDALSLQGFEVVNVTSKDAKINSYLPKQADCYHLLNLGSWDIFSILYLKSIIKNSKPDVIIAHGNRAIGFCRAICGSIPLVGVAHNYTLSGLKKCDYVIALTEHMHAYLLENNFTLKQITVIPNMVKPYEHASVKPRNDPIIIGTFGRFVHKKGMDIFLQALSLLKAKNYKFKAVIGGEGEEKEALLRLTQQLNLKEEVSLTGWVVDKEKFFQDIDIFCLPSRHEPFGIIILEAMAYSLPIVATNTEGPGEILRHEIDGLVSEVNAVDLSQKLAYLLDNPAKATEYSKNAYLRLKENYDIKIVSSRLARFIHSIK